MVLVSVVVVALAAALRLYGLGTWSIDGDELYSWYDVRRMLDGAAWPEGPRTYPLGYLGMAGVVRVLGFGEGALRLFPALCGTAAVGALAWMRRDVITARAGLFAALLAALSPWLIYHGQTARFYGPLLLFSTLLTLWSLPGAGRRPWAAAGVFVAALLCHPSAVLLLAALAWGLFVGAGTTRGAERGALAAAVLMGAAWLALGETVSDVLGRALAVEGGAAYATRDFILGLGYNLGPEVGLLAGVGCVGALRRRSPAGDLLLIAAVAGLVALLAGGLSGISIHQRYAMALVPAIVLLAGRAGDDVSRRSRGLGVLLLVMVLAAPALKLADHYRQGNRSDFRAAAAWLSETIAPEDLVVADEHSTLELYLHADPDFADIVTHEAPLTAKMMFGFVRNRHEVWVLLKANRLSGHYPAAFSEWLATYFDEVQRIGEPPLPLVRHDNVLVVYKRRVRIPTVIPESR